MKPLSSVVQLLNLQFTVYSLYGYFCTNRGECAKFENEIFPNPYPNLYPNPNLGYGLGGLSRLAI